MLRSIPSHSTAANASGDHDIFVVHIDIRSQRHHKRKYCRKQKAPHTTLSFLLKNTDATTSPTKKNPLISTNTRVPLKCSCSLPEIPSKRKGTSHFLTQKSSTAVPKDPPRTHRIIQLSIRKYSKTSQDQKSPDQCSSIPESGQTQEQSSKIAISTFRNAHASFEKIRF